MSEIPPLYSQPPLPPSMPPVQRQKVNFESISLAWKLITADIWTWAGASFVMLTVLVVLIAPVIFIFYGAFFSSIISVQATSPGRPPNFMPFGKIFAMEGLLYLAMLFIQPLQFVFHAGMMEMAMLQMDGQAISVTDVFRGFRKFGTLYLTGFLYTLAFFLGIFLCYIPAFIFMGLFSFAPILIMSGQAKGVEALKMSWRILVGDIGMIALLVFCAQLLAGLGELACGIGMIFTWAIFPVTIAYTYRNFFPSTLQQTEGPRA